MSNARAHIGLDLKRQQHQYRQFGHGTSDHHAPNPSTSNLLQSTSSSSSSARRYSSLKQTTKQHHDHGDPTKRHHASSYGQSFHQNPLLITREDSNEASEASLAAAAKHSESHGGAVQSAFNSDWISTPEFVQNETPSRKDGISYREEMQNRRRGTNFIRLVANHLKLKPICKETAYIYFHRFYMLRSMKEFEVYRIGMACLYLACKFEDHPTFKEHLIRVSYVTITRKDLSKTDKEYFDWCNNLLSDENLLLQVLGFNLQINHFQVLIVQSCSSQPMIEGVTKELYTSAYKISSEVNRLTMLCVEQPSPILACVAINLAAIFTGTTLPKGWCAHVKGATADDINLVMRITEKHKDRIASESDLAKSMIKEFGVKCFQGACSLPVERTNNADPHSSHFAKTEQLSQQILTTFSPDSAYSSNSSHSPPEQTGNFGSGSSSSSSHRQPQTHHAQPQTHQISYHNNQMINYPSIHSSHHKSLRKQFQLSTPATYSSTDNVSNFVPANSSTSKRNSSVGTIHNVSNNSGRRSCQISAHDLPQPIITNTSHQSNTQVNNNSLMALSGSRKRPFPPTSSNLNSAESSRVNGGNVFNDDVYRKRTKSDHSTGNNSGGGNNLRYQQSLLSRNDSSVNGHVNYGSNNGNKFGGSSSLHRTSSGSHADLSNSRSIPNATQYQSMPHF